MRIKRILLMCFFSSTLLGLVLPVSFCEAATGWTETYEVNPAYKSTMAQTSDGGYALAGHTGAIEYAPRNGSADYCLIKTDSSGSIEWSKTYGETNSSTLSYIIQTGDGGYAIAGSMYTGQGYGTSALLAKTDSMGYKQWSKTYVKSDEEHFFTGTYSIVQTNDGGYVLAGAVFPTGGYYLVKSDSSGNMEWSKTHGSGFWTVSCSVVQTSDGGYALVGPGEPQDGGNSPDFWLVKTDELGNMQWNQTYGGTKDEFAFSMIQTSDGGYAIAGYTESYSSGGYNDFWLVKTDSLGNEQWSKTYGGTGNEGANWLIQTVDGGFAIAGWTTSYGSGRTDFWLVKTDELGKMQWNQAYGGTNDDRAQTVVQTSNGGYTIAGYTNSYGEKGHNLLLVNTDENGIVPEFPSTLLVGVLMVLVTLVFLVYEKRTAKLSDKSIFS